MQGPPEHDQLDDALRRCGATWNAAQTHGFLCSRLAVRGGAAGSDWMQQVMAGTQSGQAGREECMSMLETLYVATLRQLAERQSEFEPLLPDDATSAATRADALAHWCEGFLHGLVSGPHPESMKAQLASEPLAGIIKDLLEITRASADSEHDEDGEQAWTELVEYIRVAVQLSYEELAGFRPQSRSREEAPGGDTNGT